MRDQWKWKLEWIEIRNARDQWKLEWVNNARWMEIRMTKQCAINGN